MKIYSHDDHAWGPRIAGAVGNFQFFDIWHLFAHFAAINLDFDDHQVTMTHDSLKVEVNHYDFVNFNDF